MGEPLTRHPRGERSRTRRPLSGEGPSGTRARPERSRLSPHSAGMTPYHALPHRRQPLLALPLHGARRLRRPHPRRGAAARRPCPRATAASATSGRARSPPPATSPSSAASTAATNEDTVRDFLAFSPDNPSSIRSCIETARDNARSVRTALTVEMWEAINGAWLELAALQRRRHEPGGVRPLPRMGEGRLARLRRLGLPHHAAQRRLLVHAARHARSSGPTTPPASST